MGSIPFECSLFKFTHNTYSGSLGELYNIRLSLNLCLFLFLLFAFCFLLLLLGVPTRIRLRTFQWKIIPIITKSIFWVLSRACLFPGFFVFVFLCVFCHKNDSVFSSNYCSACRCIACSNSFFLTYPALCGRVTNNHVNFHKKETWLGYIA